MCEFSKFTKWVDDHSYSIGYYDHSFCVEDMTFKAYMTIEHEECARAFQLTWC